MSSPKVPDKLVETTTEQAPSILNNNYIKIGGAVVAFFIFVIILYFSFRSSPVKIEGIKATQSNRCEMFPKCYFITDLQDDEKNELINKYPSLNINNKDTLFGKVFVQDSDNVQIPDVIIKSIKSQGCDLILFPYPNFKGTPIKRSGDIIVECAEGDVPLRSAIINRTK